MNIVFDEDGWGDYTFWQQHDRKVLDKINKLLAECTRTPFSGTGKPEALKHRYAGWWSRRITDEHRLVYRVQGDELWIAQCRFHYDK